MANNYATIDQLFAVMDRRTALQLSGDDNDNAGQPVNAQLLLDMSASELDSVLVGRYPVVPVVNPPLILTMIVLQRTQYALFLRRSDVPRGVADQKKQTDEWIRAFIENKVNLPGMNTQRTQPQLQDSNSLVGRSSFDGIFGVAPSPTSPGGQAEGLPVIPSGGNQSLT